MGKEDYMITEKKDLVLQSRNILFSLKCIFVYFDPIFMKLHRYYILS